jgi:hypothetical protein
MARPLNGDGQNSLVMRAASGNAAGNYFAPFGDKPLQKAVVTVINLIDFVFAKTAMTLAALISYAFRFSSIIHVYAISIKSSMVYLCHNSKRAANRLRVEVGSFVKRFPPHARLGHGRKNLLDFTFRLLIERGEEADT